VTAVAHGRDDVEGDRPPAAPAQAVQVERAGTPDDGAHGRVGQRGQARGQARGDRGAQVLVLLDQPEELAGRGGDAARRLEQAGLDALDGRLQEQVDQVAERAGGAALGGGDGVDVGDAGGDEQDQGLLEVGHRRGAARRGGVAEPGGGPRLGLRLRALQGERRPGHAGGGGLHVQAEDIVRAAEGGGGLCPVLALGVGGDVIHGGVGLQQLPLVDSVGLAEAVGSADGHALHEQGGGDADGDPAQAAPRGPEHQVARPGPPPPQFVPGLPAGATVGVAADASELRTHAIPHL